MNKTACLALSIWEISKIVMYEFWYDLHKNKISKKSKIMLHGHRQFHSLNENKRDIYSDISKDVETRLDTPNYELDKPLPKRKKMEK